MTLKLKPFFCAMLLLFMSCAVDYDMEQSSVNESERLVVNGLLSPIKPIQVHLYKLQKGQQGYSCIGIIGAHITLKENETILFDGFSSDSVFTINYLPVAGAAYSLEVSYENLPTVTAKTNIPKAIHCTARFTHGIYWDTRLYLIKLNDFDIPQNSQASLWLTAYELYEDGGIVQYNELYANNVFIDKTNSVGGMDVVNDSVGSIYYESFLRIKNTNTSKMEDLLFTPTKSYLFGEEYSSEQKKIQVKLIAASPEYDQYHKSLYEQKSMIINDDDITSVFYQPNAVYCNIENGLGIFAGMNEVDYVFDLPDETDSL
jgi:hypothetical protein